MLTAAAVSGRRFSGGYIVKKITVVFVGLLVLAMIPACKIVSRVQPGGEVQGITLAPALFDVAGETVGEYCGTYILGIDWSRLFSWESGQSGSYGGPFFPQGQAMHDALAKVEGATFLVNGQVKTEYSGVLPFYWRVCSTVRGRAVTIKSTNTN